MTSSRRSSSASGASAPGGLLAGPTIWRSGPGARAVRTRPRQRRLPGPQPDHPTLLPSTPLRAPGGAGLRGLGDRRRGVGQAAHPRTGGLDLWPITATEIPIGDYTGSMDACGVPYERLDGAEVIRRWPQWRVEPDTVALYQRRGRHRAAHPGQTRRTGRSPAAVAPRSSTRWPSAPCARPARGWRSMPAVWGCSGHARFSSAPDAWTNELTAPLGTTLPLTITKEQVTYWDIAAPARLRPRAIPGLDLDGTCPASTASRPSGSQAQGAQGRGRPTRRRRPPATSRPIRTPSPASTPS